VITIHQRYRQTDRQTTCDRNTALCTKVHRAVKTRRLWSKPKSHCDYEPRRLRESTKGRSIDTINICFTMSWRDSERWRKIARSTGMPRFGIWSHNLIWQAAT